MTAEANKLKCKKYYQEHKEELKLRSREYYAANRERMKLQSNHNYYKNKIEIKYKYILYNDTEEKRFKTKKQMCEFLGISKTILSMMFKNDRVYKGWSVDEILIN